MPSREPPTCRLRAARAEEAGALTALAHRAKAHWGYDAALMERWRAELTITPEMLGTHEALVAEIDARAVGVCLLARDGSDVQLEHFWVEPDRHGQGVGRRLFLGAARLAREGNARRLVIASDPNAEGFYLRMGATRCGVQPTAIPGRSLPLLEFTL